MNVIYLYVSHLSFKQTLSLFTNATVSTFSTGERNVKTRQAFPNCGSLMKSKCAIRQVRLMALSYDSDCLTGD